MTAPDPGLTDPLAAHQVMSQQWFPAGAEYRLVCKCGTWMGADAFPAHVALVVEQHTNGRVVELEAESEDRLREIVGMTEAWGKARRRELAATARAEKAEAELEKYHAEERRELEWERNRAQDDVRCVRCNLRYGERDQYGCMEPARAHDYDEDELRAALEGEQR